MTGGPNDRGEETGGKNVLSPDPGGFPFLALSS